MKITQDVREYAERHGAAAANVHPVGMSVKAKEFVATAGSIYHGNVPCGADDHH